MWVVKTGDSTIDEFLDFCDVIQANLRVLNRVPPLEIKGPFRIQSERYEIEERLGLRAEFWELNGAMEINKFYEKFIVPGVEKSLWGKYWHICRILKSLAVPFYFKWNDGELYLILRR